MAVLTNSRDADSVTASSMSVDGAATPTRPGQCGAWRSFGDRRMSALGSRDPQEQVDRVYFNRKTSISIIYPVLALDFQVFLRLPYICSTLERGSLVRGHESIEDINIDLLAGRLGHSTRSLHLNHPLIYCTSCLTRIIAVDGASSTYEASFKLIVPVQIRDSISMKRRTSGCPLS